MVWSESAPLVATAAAARSSRARAAAVASLAALLIFCGVATVQHSLQQQGGLTFSSKAGLFASWKQATALGECMAANTKTNAQCVRMHRRSKQFANIDLCEGTTPFPTEECCEFCIAHNREKMEREAAIAGAAEQYGADPASMAQALAEIEAMHSKSCSLTHSPRPMFVVSPNCTDLPAGRSCGVHCAAHFVGAGTELSCPANNAWAGATPDGVMPVCLPVKPCRALAAADVQSIYDVTKCGAPVTAGGSCVVICGPGFDESFGVLECPWNNTNVASPPAGTLPTCTAKVACSPLRDLGPEYDVTGCGGVMAGDTCEVTCSAGFTAAANATFVCDSHNVDTAMEPRPAAGVLSMACKTARPCGYSAPYSRVELQQSFYAFSQWDNQISRVDIATIPNLADSFETNDIDRNGFIVSVHTHRTAHLLHALLAAGTSWSNDALAAHLV